MIGFPYETPWLALFKKKRTPWLVSSWPGSGGVGSCEPGSIERRMKLVSDQP